MAIDYKQLRAGNLVKNHKGEVHVITPWDIWNFECMVRPGMHFDKRLEDWQYIPLDEDVLINMLGFENEYESKFRKVLGLSFLGRHWSFNFSKTPKETNHFEIKGFAIDMSLVENIHQVQNLWHSLNGVELEVKL
jgi:hypothetical protein